jgi:hypothetical protein
MQETFCLNLTAPEIEELRTLIGWGLNDTGSNERAARYTAIQRQLSKIRLVEPLPGTEEPAATPIVRPDPDGQNADRAEWAASALRHFQCTTGTDYDDALADLLCDLMHWCDREGLSFNDALSNGTSHYTAETTDPAIVTCDACGAETETVIGCPDGREICPTCAADGVG